MHQMRNSMKYITEKDMKPMVRDLKKIYTAPNPVAAEQYLTLAEETWGSKYWVVFRS